MIGKLKNKDIEELLSKQVVGRIGCHADGLTYVVPISYAYDGSYVYAHAMEGMKVKIMRANPQVCFEVDELKDMANWKSVIAWGEFEELKEKSERRKAIRHLVDRILPLISSETTHLSKLWPFPDNDNQSIRGVIFRIRLKEKTGRFETNAVSGAYAT